MPAKGAITAEAAESAEREKIIQWVAEKDFVKCSVLIPEEMLDEEGRIRKDSLKTAVGYAESYAKNLKERDIVQFERFGYCTLDDKEKVRFIFISK